MINFRPTLIPYMYSNCGKLTMETLIDICVEGTIVNANIGLCSACQCELARKILFRIGKEKISEVIE